MRYPVFILIATVLTVAGCDKDDRRQVAQEYLNEFCSPALLNAPKIHTALENVLAKVPRKDLAIIADRRRPVFFTEVYDQGTARFANSAEIIVGKDDPPCCQEGFTMIKLSMALEGAQTPTAIEGVVAHELAHRVLDHVRKGKVGCNSEREANALIKQWGFGAEYQAASKTFGHRDGDPAACQESKP